MKLRSILFVGLALAAAVGLLSFAGHAQDPTPTANQDGWKSVDTELNALARDVQDKKAPAAQDKKPAAQADQMPEEKPAPEHALLAKWVGTWDADINALWTGKPERSKGTMVCKLVGPFWLVSDMSSTMSGKPFFGHEVDGWDGAKKKYTSYWFDSTGSGATTGEGTFDAPKKTMTMNLMMAMGPQSVPMTSVFVWKDDNNVTLTMSGAAPDGKPMTFMTIDYTRKK